MSVKWSWCSNLNRWDLFFIERFVCCMTKKSWAFSDLVAAISAALHENFVCSKYANSVSQFLLYWMRIICCIYKDFVRQLKAFLPSLCHLCACEMSPGWRQLITWMDLVWGIWTASVKRRSRRTFFRWWNPTWPESPSCCWPIISFVWARRLTNWTNRCRNVINLFLTKEYV